MKLTVLVSTLLWTTFLIAQNPVNKMYQGESEGKHSDLHINGKVRCEYNIQDGNLHGSRVCHYNNGALWVVEQFDKGMFNGTNYLLNKSQDTVYIEKYSMDTLLYSKNYEYFKNGALKQVREVQYINDPTLTHNPFKKRKKWGGIIISLRETEENISNNGVLKFYYKSGNIQSIGELKNTNYNGTYLEFYETGELKIDAYLVNNEFHGRYLVYNKKGIVEEDYTFLNGVKQ